MAVCYHLMGWNVVYEFYVIWIFLCGFRVLFVGCFVFVVFLIFNINFPISCLNPLISRQWFEFTFSTPRLEWEIEKHKWSFSARLAVTSSWSFWSSAIHVALVKARRKTWRRLRWHVAPRVAAVCIPVVPAATNARIARANEATAFVVAVGHIIINWIIILKISLAIHNTPDDFFTHFMLCQNQ